MNSPNRMSTKNHIFKHEPVADEAVDRVLEGGRLVHLHEEVGDPGKGVSLKSKTNPDISFYFFGTINLVQNRIPK